MIHLRNPDEATVRRAVIDILSTVRNRSALAGKLGVHRTTLYKWESGASRLTIPMLSRLCKALDIQLRIDFGPEIEDDDVLTTLRRIERRCA